MQNFIFLSATVILLSACGAKKKDVELINISSNENIVTLTNVQSKNAGISVGKMEQKEISSILKVYGKIDVPPQNMVSISVPLGGYLKTTRLLPGVHVNKGEVLAVMEDQQYIQLQQDYLTAKAKISYLENEYKRQKDLNESKAVSDKVYQQSEADYRSQRIMISALAEKLKLAGINIGRISETKISRSINIISPINGFVTKVNVNIGKYVSPTDVMFELVNPSDIHLALKVFEKDLDKLHVGQKLVAYTNNKIDKKYNCEISIIGKDISMDRNTDVHCHFEKYDKVLIPGTYMNAEIELKNNKTFVLPDEAVVTFENKQFVFKVKGNNQFEITEVATGENEKGFTEIILPQQNKNNMTSADFVVKGAYSLLMMMKNKAE